MADIESLSASIQHEDEENFTEEQENETPSESQAENNEQPKTSPSHQGEEDNTDDESKKKTEDFVPYDRFKEVIRDKNELKQKLEELEQTVQQKLNVPLQEEVHIPNWFSRLYGDDKDAWNEYQSYENTKFKEWHQNIRQEELNQKKQYEDNIKRWEKYTDEQIQKLQDEGKDLEKNEFMKIVLDYRPTDEQGNIDFGKAYKIYESQKKSDYNPLRSQAKKNIASSTVSENKGGEVQKRDYATSNDFRGKTALDLI